MSTTIAPATTRLTVAVTALPAIRASTAGITHSIPNPDHYIKSAVLSLQGLHGLQIVRQQAGFFGLICDYVRPTHRL